MNMNTILDYRVDVVLFIVVSMIGILFARHRMLRNLHRTPRRVVVAFFITLIATTVLAVITGEMERSQLIRMVSGLAPTYAMELDAMGLQKITPDTPADDPLYLSLIEKQKTWLSLNPAIADIYTVCQRPDGSIILMVDSETDYNRDGVFGDDREARTDIATVYESEEGTLAKDFQSGESIFNPLIETDAWGTWVSAMEPLRDANGQVYAYLGIDFPAEKWVRAILFARASVLLLGGFVIAILLVFSTMAYQLKSEVQRRCESEEAVLASEARLRLIVDNEPECVMVLSRTGQIMEINPAGLRALGTDGSKWPCVIRPVSDCAATDPPEGF